MFAEDQLADRIMLREMGNGVRDVVIRFENPVVITQRNSEKFLNANNFSKPEALESEKYPSGAYAYSQLLPMVINFERPVKL